MRRDARTEADKLAFTQAANEHKTGVFADRSVGRKLMYMSENASRQGSSYVPAHGVLYLCLDGMDQVFWHFFKQFLYVASFFELFPTFQIEPTNLCNTHCV